MMAQHYGLPLECFDGGKAVTVQSFTEVNSKAGEQYEAADYLSSATVADLIIRTGSNPVIIKAFLFQFDGDGMQYQVFEGPTFSDVDLGTELGGYPLSKRHDHSPDTVIYRIADANVSDDGTAKTPVISLIGTSAPGVSATPTGNVEGVERILKPDTDYLLKREGLTGGQAAQQLSLYVTWYEGEISVDTSIDEGRV